MAGSAEVREEVFVFISDLSEVTLEANRTCCTNRVILYTHTHTHARTHKHTQDDRSAVFLTSTVRHNVT